MKELKEQIELIEGIYLSMLIADGEELIEAEDKLAQELEKLFYIKDLVL